MSTLDRRGFLSGTAAAAALATLEPAAILAQPAPGQIDAKAQFGSLLISAEFEEAPHALNPAIIAEFTSQNAMREVVKSGPERRHVLSGLPPVMMQGTNTSLGYPGSCEADSFGYGLGTYTAARGYPQFDPAGGPANRLSAAWLFSWAQRRQRNTTCGGSLALPYLGLLIVKGAPNEQQVPYEPKCPYIQGVNTDLESYSDVGKFRIGSYKT